MPGLSSRIGSVEPVCAICGNTDDLCAPYGVPYCLQCRLCGHYELYDVPCEFCFRERFTAWTFLGPCIVDMEQYLNLAMFYAVPMKYIKFWRYAEEEYFQRYQWTTNVYGQVGLDKQRYILAGLTDLHYPLFHLSPRGPRRPR